MVVILFINNHNIENIAQYICCIFFDQFLEISLKQQEKLQQKIDMIISVYFLLKCFYQKIQNPKKYPTPPPMSAMRDRYLHFLFLFARYFALALPTSIYAAISMHTILSLQGICSIEFSCHTFNFFHTVSAAVIFPSLLLSSVRSTL